MGTDKLCDFCIHRWGHNPTCFPSKVTIPDEKCPVQICVKRIIDIKSMR